MAGSNKSKVDKTQPATNKKKIKSLSSRAQLIFPVGRLKSLLAKNNVRNRISPRAAIALAAALDYFAGEILSNTNDVMCESERASGTKTPKRMTTRSLNLVLKTDTEFLAFLKNSTIRNSGVIPIKFVSKKQSALMKAAARKEEQEEEDTK